MSVLFNTMKYVIKIQTNGEMNEHQIDEKSNIYNELELISSKKGFNDISFLYEWNYDDYFIKIYGWTEGDMKHRNNHILPNNGNDIKSLNIASEDIGLYGDIIIIKTDNNNTLYDIMSEEYGEFYNIIYDCKDDTNSETDTDNVEGVISDNEENYVYQMEYIENYEDLIYESDIKSFKEDIKPISKLKGKKKKAPVYMGNILHKDTNTYKEYNV